METTTSIVSLSAFMLGSFLCYVGTNTSRFGIFFDDGILRLQGAPAVWFLPYPAVRTRRLSNACMYTLRRQEGDASPTHSSRFVLFFLPFSKAVESVTGGGGLTVNSVLFIYLTFLFVPAAPLLATQLWRGRYQGMMTRSRAWSNGRRTSPPVPGVV